MAGIPTFPLSGAPLSKSLDLDRISLIENTIGSPTYPIGQYIFFTKTQSIWYRYTNATTPWTNDILWMANARESSVKFDASGYAFGAYISNLDNSLNIRHVFHTIDSTKQIAPSGRFPTVQIDSNDIYVFWVPFPYLNSLEYCQGCDFFSAMRTYLFPIPSTIEMLDLQLISTNQWVFTVTINGNPANTVYRIVTNPIS